MIRNIKLLYQLNQSIRDAKAPREAVLLKQERALRKLLSHAYRNAPFYRERFRLNGIRSRDIGTAPLSAFPDMEKADFLEHFDEIVTVKHLRQAELRRFDADEKNLGKTYPGGFHLIHSSGSTGEPSYFVYDSAAWETVLTGIIRGAMWEMGMPQILRFMAEGLRVLYVATTDGRYAGAMAIGDGLDGLKLKRMFLDINEPMSAWRDKVRSFQPNVLLGYPSAIGILASCAGDYFAGASVKRIITCGEPLTGAFRKNLEETFHCPVFNFYGASEFLALGVEGSGGDGICLFDDLNVIEVEGGETRVTSLYHFAQPLIRYRLTDRLTVLPEQKNSPYGFRRVHISNARSEDVLWFEDASGKREFLHPLSIEGFSFPGLLDYQFLKTGRDSFELLAETARDADRDAIRVPWLGQLHAILAEKRLSYVRFSIRFVDHIEPDLKSGKKRLVRVADDTSFGTRDLLGSISG